MSDEVPGDVILYGVTSIKIPKLISKLMPKLSRELIPKLMPKLSRELIPKLIP